MAPLSKEFYPDGFQLMEKATEAPKTMHAKESSSCCMRFCWRDGRGWDIHLRQGADGGGEELVRFKKPCGCPLKFYVPIGENGGVECPCCCGLPKADMLWAD